MREMSDLDMYAFNMDTVSVEDFDKIVRKYKAKDRFTTIIYNTTESERFRNNLINKFGFKEIGSYMGNHNTRVYIMQKDV